MMPNNQDCRDDVRYRWLQEADGGTTDATTGVGPSVADLHRLLKEKYDDVSEKNLEIQALQDKNRGLEEKASLQKRYGI